MRKSIAVLTVLLVTALAATAYAAKPHLGSRWSGGDGRGGPMGFTLDKKGNVTAAFTSYTCKGKSGIGSASTSKRAGKLDAKNKLTIVFTTKRDKLTVTMKLSFPTKKTARGTITFKSPTCSAPKKTVTAVVGAEG